MQVHNRDVFPPEDAAGLYPMIAPLLVHPLIDDAFEKREVAANKAKKLYHSRGRFAIILIALGAIYTVAEALVMPALWAETALGALIALLAAAGVVLQAFIIVTRQKEVWLLNRFAAERIRSLKFQAYALAEHASSIDALKERVEEFYRAALISVQEDENAGVSRLQKFVPREALQDHKPTMAAPQAELLSQARDGYHRFRIAYQKRFADAELQTLSRGSRFGDTSSDVLYLAGALLVVLSLALKLIPGSEEIMIAWIDFLAVASFIVAASKSILENASLASQTRTRYEQYARDLEKVEIDFKNGSSIGQIVRRMELIAMSELDDFCRSAAKISYRL